MHRLVIDQKAIDDTTDCYSIAEIGHNHQGEVETCMEMFKVAKECGANAVKLQKRDNRSLYTAGYAKPYDNENSYGATYGEHREALEFGRERVQGAEGLRQGDRDDDVRHGLRFPERGFSGRARHAGLQDRLGRSEQHPAARHMAKIGKPIILSTGGGTMEDVHRAYDAIMPINPQLCILQCTAGYPAAFEELNLRVITTFRERFPEAVVGLSSHDNGIAMALAAYVLGARVVEKHFTLNRAMKGTDHAFSLEPIGFQKMVRDLRRVRHGDGRRGQAVYDSEEAPMVKMGKKLVAARDLPAGHAIRREDIAIKSPGDGLPPYEIDKVIGRTDARGAQGRRRPSASRPCNGAGRL